MEVRATAFFCIIASVIIPTSAGAAQLIVTPQRSSIDAPLSVKIAARAGDTVHVRLTTKRYGLSFASELDVVARGSGLFEVPNASRLLWSVMPTNTPPQNVAFRRDIDLMPREYRFEATNGRVTAATTIERLALLPNLRRTVIDDGTLVGTMFTGQDSACRAGIVVLGGSEGGVPEERAAVLAGHGFATLALAYFDMPQLPKELSLVPIELVQRGVEFMKANPAVCHDRPIGIFGGSKGAELALLSAVFFNDIGAVAAISPSSVVFSGIGAGADTGSSWSYRGKPLPFGNGVVPESVTNAIAVQKNAGSKISYVDEYSSMLTSNTDPAAAIPVTRTSGPILLIAGGDDKLWPSLTMARQIVSSLRQRHFPFTVDLLSYPSAGHAIGIPYQFAAAELAHSRLDLGGTPEANEAACEDSWPKIVSFFSAALNHRV